jgi:hypothetical protein
VSRARAAGVGLLMALVAFAGTAALKPQLRRWLGRGRPTAPTVLFVVMDTVRADHLSACGYGRPTSPTLEALVAGGAQLSCRAMAPADWTFPSHASYFTGLPPWAHGGHFVAAGGAELRQMMVRPLPADADTLAEALRARGFQTAGVSGNPVLNPVTGLGQGFDQWRVAGGFGAWSGERLLQQVDATLGALDPDGGPLFLFVNIADAHDPWDGVPEGLGWAPAQAEGLAWFETDPATGAVKPDGPWQRYVRGELPPAEAAALRARVTDLYDHALWEADQTLGGLLERVRAWGWADAGLRLVVTSDHGEFLGEHGLMQHGHALWEENQRVFLLTDGLEVQLDRDAPMAALEAHALLRDGARPSPAPPMEAASWPDQLWAAQSGGRIGTATEVARWEGPQKLRQIDEQALRVDLAADPAEAAPAPAPAGALGPLMAAARASAAAPVTLDPAVIEALQAAGYIDGGPPAP